MNTAAEQQILGDNSIPFEIITSWRYNFILSQKRSLNVNDNFNNVYLDSGLSMYSLSRRSGVPYTTINEIRNSKIDINLCAAGTVTKIAAALGTDTQSIMNPVRLLDGVRGKYRNVSYFWKDDAATVLNISTEGIDYTIETGKQYRIPRWREYYDILAEWLIDDWLEKKSWVKDENSNGKGE